MVWGDTMGQTQPRPGCAAGLGHGTRGRSAVQAGTSAHGPLFSSLWNWEIEGLEHVPEDGGAIVAPNHLSVFDHFAVAAALPRRITYVGKAEYMDSWKTRYIFPALGMIPIDRGGGSAAERALDKAAQLLDSGELFGIYPEGTRSRDGRLHKGHTGAARLALRTGCPILPVGLQGPSRCSPPTAPCPRRSRPSGCASVGPSTSPAISTAPTTA